MTNSFSHFQEQIYYGNNNLFFQTLIVGIETFSESYNILILYDNQKISKNFLLNVNQIISVGTLILIKNVIIKELNEILYFIIDKFINEKALPNPKCQKLLKSEIFEFKKVKKYNCLNELKNINEDSLVSIDLRVNIFDKGHPKFIDYERQNIKINFRNFNLKFFEKRQKYSFLKCLFKKNNNELIIIEISSIIKLDENSFLKKEDYENIKSIKKIENNHICNCFGKIIFSNFLTNIIILKDIDNNNTIKIELNENLIKLISFNGICFFKNFKKCSDNYLKVTNISNIIIEEKTIIELIFLDYKNENNKYNKIKVNEQIVNINNKIIEFELKKVKFQNYFTQKVIFFNDLNDKIKESNELIFYVYKGQKNSFISYLNLENDGYCYEFFYQANKEEFLPKTQIIKINNKEVIIDKTEKFNNTLKERFNFINIQKQNIGINENIPLLNLNNQLVKDEECKCWKIVNLISESKTTTVNIFKIKDSNNKILKNFEFESNFEKQLNSFYKNYKSDICNYYNNKLKINGEYNLLFNDDETSLTNNENKIIYTDYIKSGFIKYQFKNSQTHYKNMKKLCFLLLIKYSFLSLKGLISLINQYKSLLKEITKLNYINKIKIIIHYTDYHINETINDNKIYNFEFIHLDFEQKFFSLKKAHNFLIQIINNMNEESYFFKGLQEINSFIEYDYLNCNYIFNSSLLTLNDIKLELIKTINKYYFINPIKKGDDLSNFHLNSGIITIYPCILLKNNLSEIIDCSNNEINDNYSLLIILILIYEICSYMIKNSNNQINNSSNFFYKLNLKIDKIIGEEETGNIFEYLMNENTFPINKLLNKKGMKKFLNFDLYIKETFENFKLLIKQFTEKEINIKIKNKIIISPTKINKKKVNTLNLEDDKNENYDGYTIHDLFELINNVPEGMTKDEYEVIVKKTNAYKKLHEIFKNKPKTHKY